MWPSEGTPLGVEVFLGEMGRTVATRNGSNSYKVPFFLHGRNQPFFVWSNRQRNKSSLCITLQLLGAKRSPGIRLKAEGENMNVSQLGKPDWMQGHQPLATSHAD